MVCLFCSAWSADQATKGSKERWSKNKTSKVCQFIQSIWCLFQLTQLYFFPLILPKTKKKQKKGNSEFPTRWAHWLVINGGYMGPAPTYHGMGHTNLCKLGVVTFPWIDPTVPPRFPRLGSERNQMPGLKETWWRRWGALHGEPWGLCYVGSWNRIICKCNVYIYIYGNVIGTCIIFIDVIMWIIWWFLDWSQSLMWVFLV